MDLYIDVLFLENLCINFLILFLTQRFLKVNISTLRLFLGAFVGASYVLVLVFIPALNGCYSILAKVLLSFLIIAITFRPDKIKTFIRTFFVFYVVSFVFAGAAFAFIFLNKEGGIVRNGICYIYRDSKFTVVVLSIFTLCILFRIFYDFLQCKLTKNNFIVSLQIAFESNIVKVLALIDTGNSLFDPITKVPVVIVEFNAIKNILPNEIKRVFNEDKEGDLESISKVISSSDWYLRFRIIPFKSLGNSNGVLIGFKPDKVEIFQESERKTTINNVIIGIYNNTLSQNDSYRALLSPELMST